MGFDKFLLPMGDRTFLESVVEKLISTVDGPIIAAASSRTIEAVQKVQAGLKLDRFIVVQDENENSGPLEGIRVGLKYANASSKWAFVTSCDAPLICPKVPQLLISAIEKMDDPEIEAAIPMSPGRIYGMTAVYRCDTFAKVSAMVERGQLRVSDLANELQTTKIGLEEIRTEDPNLDSMKNLNSATEYLEFLRNRGFECSPEIEAQLLTMESEQPNDD